MAVTWNSGFSNVSDKGMSKPTNSINKVKETLNVLGYPCQIIELSQMSRTSAEAAAAVGCGIGQIAKSLIFKGTISGKAILVIVSGSNRVNEKRLSCIVGEPIEKPNAAFVKEATGFAIGGVPPVGHIQKLETVIDEDLLKYDGIWAAAGSPTSVFKLNPNDLSPITGGMLSGIK